MIDIVKSGNLEEVTSLLRRDPRLNVNAKDDMGWASLHWASAFGYLPVVKFLLASPGIDVNIAHNYGGTPLAFSCLEGRPQVTRVLLKDHRVNTTFLDDKAASPLWHAASQARLEVVKELIASGRDLGDLSQMAKSSSDRKYYTTLEVARKAQGAEVVALLEQFVANPEKTRREIRVKLGMLEELAANVFALVIFLCDDLLQLKEVPTPDVRGTDAAHFFSIARRLPMELQMILCKRAVGSMKQTVLRKDSEPAFKDLAKILVAKTE